MERCGGEHCNYWHNWSRKIKFYQHNQRVSIQYILLFFSSHSPEKVARCWNSLVVAIKWDENQPFHKKRNSLQHHDNIVTKSLLVDLCSIRLFRKIQDGTLTKILELFLRSNKKY